MALVAGVLSSSPAAAATVQKPVVHYLHPHVPRPDAADVIERPASGHEDGPLLLFLPATRAVPSDYLTFEGTAADVGYHVLALAYHNTGRSVTRTCRGDAACYTSVQTNRLDGGAASRFSRVSREGGILPRFSAAIQAAERSDPTGDWSRYVSSSGPVWNDIVVAGHSQGGGEAAFISHLHSVRGVLMFSSPVDDYQGVIPTWMHSAGATPASRMYGLDDAGDMYMNRIVGSWRAMGIRSAVDTGAPRAGAHLFLSHDDLGTPSQSHDRTVTDASPCASSGRPVFQAQWLWMLRHTYSAEQTDTVTALAAESAHTGRS